MNIHVLEPMYILIPAFSWHHFFIVKETVTAVMLSNTLRMLCLTYVSETTATDPDMVLCYLILPYQVYCYTAIPGTGSFIGPIFEWIVKVT